MKYLYIRFFINHSAIYVVYFALTAHLNLNNSHFNYSVVTVTSDCFIRQHSPRKYVKCWWSYIVENSYFKKYLKYLSFLSQNQIWLFECSALSYTISRKTSIYNWKISPYFLRKWVGVWEIIWIREGSTQSRTGCVLATEPANLNSEEDEC